MFPTRKLTLKKKPTHNMMQYTPEQTQKFYNLVLTNQTVYL